MTHIKLDSIKTLIKEIYTYTHCIKEELNINELCFANEIDSVNYIESFYKLIDLTKNSYYNYHMKVKDKYYEIFIYKDEEIDIENLYQVIICNNYTQVFNFKQDDYENRKLLANFKNPGRVYSFYNGYVIIIETEYRMDYNEDEYYEEII